MREPARRPQALPADIAAYYAYPLKPTDATIRGLSEQARYQEYLVQFPLSVPDFEPTEPVVEFEWFEAKREGKSPAILFNPILGGDYPIERAVSRSLSRNGFHVALVHRKTLKISPEHNVSHIELLLRQGIMRIRQIVDWMERRENVDASRMASFGISMGGIASAITAALEPRLRAHVVALAGGGIPDILMGSKDRLLAKPRRVYLERNGMDLETLSRLLREHVRTDPILLAPYVDSRQIFMFVALSDRTIGRRNSLRLWRALGKPRCVFNPLGHYTSYVYLPYLKYTGIRFLRRALGISTGASQEALPSHQADTGKTHCGIDAGRDIR